MDVARLWAAEESGSKGTTMPLTYDPVPDSSLQDYSSAY